MVSADTFVNLRLQDEFLSDVMPFGDVIEKKCPDFTGTDFNTAARGTYATTYLSTDSTAPAFRDTCAIRADTIRIPSSSHPLSSSHSLAHSSGTSFGAPSTDGSGSEISSPTQGDVFSPSSSISSSSSVSDSSYTRHGGQDSFAANYANLQNHSHLNTRNRRHLDHNSASTGVTSSASCSKEGQKVHPRRTAVSASWAQPRLVRQNNRRHQLVENLVGKDFHKSLCSVVLETMSILTFHITDSATHLVSLIWPESGSKESFQGKIVSLRHFIRETLRRSRTSYSTLQVTLWYLILLRPYVREFCRNSKADPDQTPQLMHTGNGSSNFRAARCGRRMFLAALILASKFLQDRNYTAKAWSKITGLRTQEIVENEFNFLAAIGWKLHLKEQDFAHWNHIILRCTESTWPGQNIRTTLSQILTMFEDGFTLHQICSFLDLRISCPVPVVAGHTLEDARSDACFKVPPRPTSLLESQVDLPDEKLEKEPYTPEPNARPALPAQPTLGGKLATPQLTPKAASSNLSTPAAGTLAPTCSFGLQPKTTQSNNDDAYLTRAWDNALSEFPMDLVKTPESMSSEDRIHPGTSQLATRNQAFGLITPSSSFGSDSSVTDETSPNDTVPRHSAQACMLGQGMWACEPAQDSRIHGNPSNEFRQASNWIDMLAQAAETVSSRTCTADERPVPKACRRRGSTGGKALSLSTYNEVGLIQEYSSSESHVIMNEPQHTERAESAQPLVEAFSENRGDSDRLRTAAAQSVHGLVSSALPPTSQALPMNTGNCHTQDNNGPSSERPAKAAMSKSRANQGVAILDRKRSSPDSSCVLPNAKVRCCGTSSCL